MRSARPPVRQTEAVVVSNSPLNAESWILTLEAGSELPLSRPGQFVHLRVSEQGWEPFLRRPFSILGHRRLASGGSRLELMYAVVGRGTERLAAARPGERRSVVGPLGNGFRPDGFRTWIAVAGGRGAAPLFRLLEAERERGADGSAVRFLFGARGRGELWGLERLDGVSYRLATDDGSCGHHGTVVDLLRQTLAEEPPAPVVLACGPEPMLAAVAGAAAAAGVPAQVSLENRMGCGTGLCRGCVIPRRPGPDALWDRDGNATYGTVCKEGPVFLGSEVDWPALPPI